MSEITTDKPRKVNNSIFTKRRVHELLRSVTDEVRGMKSPKAIIEHLEATAKQYVPSGRGRQPGSSVDFTALQAVVDETAASVCTNDASFILGMSAAKFNVRDGFSGPLMDTMKLRKYVEKGKLTLPEHVMLVKRQRKTAEVPVSE